MAGGMTSLLALATVLVALGGLTHGFSLVSPVEKSNRGALNVIVTLRDGTSHVVEQVKSRDFPTREQRLSALVDSLKEHSARSQSPVLDILNKEKLIKPGMRVSPLTVTNQIIIKGADFNLISRLSNLEQVWRVEEERFVRMEKPSEMAEVVGRQSSALDAADAEEQWGVVAIQAPDVWETGNRGEGVIVSSIGTGVRGTHEALRGNYLGDDGGWLDPLDGTGVPNDPNGLGTHVMGTMVGQVRGIGVAPGSLWSACKACSPAGICSTADLLKCADWVLCPNPPTCSKAPRVVNNMWGGGAGSEGFFDGVLQTWEAAGIVGVFPIGGSGPSCGSLGSPGDSAFAIGVTATTVQDQVAENSGAGPGPDEGRVKPDVAAPGQNILSAFGNSDTGYVSASGTSLASPHVAGLVALILHERPNATSADILGALRAGADPTVPTGRNCGGIPETQFPNYVSGYGRVNALKSVSSAA